MHLMMTCDPASVMGENTIFMNAHFGQDGSTQIRSCCAACEYYLGKTCKHMLVALNSSKNVHCDKAWWGSDESIWHGGVGNHTPPGMSVGIGYRSGCLQYVATMSTDDVVCKCTEHTASAFSPISSTGARVCECKGGYPGTDSESCEPCAAGKYQALTLTDTGPIKVGRGCPVLVSSDWSSGNVAGPSPPKRGWEAVDGITGGSHFHTICNRANEWFMLDLVSEYDVVAVKIWNRVDKLSRLAGAEIRVGNDATSFRGNRVCASSIPGDAVVTGTCPQTYRGRYVFVVQPRNNTCLHFQEIEVTAWNLQKACVACPALSTAPAGSQLANCSCAAQIDDLHSSPVTTQFNNGEIHGRCGPLFNHIRCGGTGGTANPASAIYCNEANGYCGNSAAHKNAQASTTYDFVPNSAAPIKLELSPYVRWLVDGCPGTHEYIVIAPFLADVSAAVGRVACCRMEYDAVRKDASGACMSGSYAPDVVGGAVYKTFIEAETICKGQGWRVCRKEELSTPGASGSCVTGCGLDADIVWADFDPGERPSNCTSSTSTYGPLARTGSGPT